MEGPEARRLRGACLRRARAGNAVNRWWLTQAEFTDTYRAASETLP